MYKIYCENRYPEMVTSILQARVGSYTVTEAKGAWLGKPEDSLVIDLVGVPYQTVWDIANAIREMQNNDAVVIVQFETSVTYAVKPAASEEVGT